MPESVFKLELPEKEPAGLWFLRMCIVNAVMSNDYAFTWTDCGDQTKAFFHVDPNGYTEELELSYPLSQLEAHLADRGMLGREGTGWSATISFGAERHRLRSSKEAGWTRGSYSSKLPRMLVS